MRHKSDHTQLMWELHRKSIIIQWTHRQHVSNRLQKPTHHRQRFPTYTYTNSYAHKHNIISNKSTLSLHTTICAPLHKITRCSSHHHRASSALDPPSNKQRLWPSSGGMPPRVFAQDARTPHAAACFTLFMWCEEGCSTGPCRIYTCIHTDTPS